MRSYMSVDLKNGLYSMGNRRGKKIVSRKQLKGLSWTI